MDQRLTATIDVERPAGRAPWWVRMFANRPTWRFSALLALQAAFIFLVVPLLSEREIPRAVTQIITLAVTTGTILLVSDNPRVRLVVGLVFLLLAVSHVRVGLVPLVVGDVLAALYFSVLTIVLARSVFSPGSVDHHRIAGAASVYLSISVVFAAVFAIVRIISPDSFSGLSDQQMMHTEDMIHFSLVTLTTLGYGDILPRTPMARSIADLEAIIGQLFPAILLARMVGLSVGPR
jgi:hypothetical protein